MDNVEREAWGFVFFCLGYRFYNSVFNERVLVAEFLVYRSFFRIFRIIWKDVRGFVISRTKIFGIGFLVSVVFYISFCLKRWGEFG